jgi:HK97 family phage major capsid protein
MDALTLSAQPLPKHMRHNIVHQDLEHHDPATASLEASKLSLSRTFIREARPKVSTFSLARALCAVAENRPLPAFERAVLEERAETCGQDLNRERLWVRMSDLRTMATTPGAKGGYLVGTEMMAPAEPLRPWSVALQSGAQYAEGLESPLALPIITSDPAAEFVAEGVAPTASDPVIGLQSATAHTCVAIIDKVSLQLLRQGPAIEGVLGSMLFRALGRKLDAVVLGGAGGVEPLGVYSATGIGTQAGAALAHAGLLAMRKQVLDAGAMESNLRWIGTPTVQQVLGGREAFTGGGRTLWQDGSVLGLPAAATKDAPTATIGLGDWNQVLVTVFSTMRLDIDRSTHFNSGCVSIRALLFCDVVALQPGALCVATAVS